MDADIQKGWRPWEIMEFYMCFPWYSQQCGCTTMWAIGQRQEPRILLSFFDWARRMAFPLPKKYWILSTLLIFTDKKSGEFHRYSSIEWEVDVYTCLYVRGSGSGGCMCACHSHSKINHSLFPLLSGMFLHAEPFHQPCSRKLKK